MQTGIFLIGSQRAALNLCGAAAVLWAAALPAASQPLTPTAVPAPTAMSAAEIALLDAINDYRRMNGRTPWAVEPGLAAVARAHSQAMAQRGGLSHDGFTQRAEATGSALCVENLLLGSVSPARAVLSWTASVQHRNNLLEPGARFAGIGMTGRFVSMLACASPAVNAVRAESPPPHDGPAK